MNIYDELKRSKDFVYSVKNKKFIIGYGVFLDCPNDIENLYDVFMEKVDELVIEMEKDSPQRHALNDCIESFNVLMQAIFKITYNNMSDDYEEKLWSFDESLSLEEKEKVKHQRELFILFLELDFKNKVKYDISPDDIFRLKELRL